MLTKTQRSIPTPSSSAEITRLYFGLSCVMCAPKSPVECYQISWTRSSPSSEDSRQLIQSTFKRNSTAGIRKKPVPPSPAAPAASSKPSGIAMKLSPSSARNLRQSLKSSIVSSALAAGIKAPRLPRFTKQRDLSILVSSSSVLISYPLLSPRRRSKSGKKKTSSTSPSPAPSPAPVR